MGDPRTGAVRRPPPRAVRAWSPAAAGARTRFTWAAVLLVVFALVVGLDMSGGPRAAAAVDCPAGSSVNVIAHPDDDLFFQNPDVLKDVAAGKCVATVYLTSGDAGIGTGYSRSRENGVGAAYATMAGVANTWTSSTVTVAGKGVTTRTLSAAPRIQQFFLRLPDGNIDGSGFPRTGRASLQKLYQGQIASMSTADAPIQSYTKAQLVQTLGGLMTSVSAGTVRTLDNVDAYGQGDHSDHYTAARLATEARAAAAPAAALIGYLGYPSSDLPANVSGADLNAKQNAFLSYAPYDSQMCQSLAACAARPEGTWLPRQYRASWTPRRHPPGRAVMPRWRRPPPPPPRTRPTGRRRPRRRRRGRRLSRRLHEGVGDRRREGRQLAAAELAGAGGLDHVVLFDRPNGSDQVTGGTLTFSDGSTVAVPSLDNAGGAVTVSFTARTTSSLRFTVNSVSAGTSNVGLAELQAWTPGSSTPPPTTTPPTTTPPTTTRRPTTPPTTPASGIDERGAHRGRLGVLREPHRRADRGEGDRRRGRRLSRATTRRSGRPSAGAPAAGCS